ncbi:MAG: dTDP-glucose 4,6-dehydratase [Candidatus Methanosuratincola petrocarbonis]
MRLLVTGGLGFIGSNFIRLCLSSGNEVVNLDNLSYGSNEANLREFASDPRYKFVKGDICEPEPVRQALGMGVDAVVNFAAETHVDRSISNPLDFYRTNVGGVLNLLECIRKSGRSIRFVQIGTDESYGDIAEGSFVETDPLSPSSPYSASKASADLFVLAYRRTYGIDALVTRCTNNFGPFQFPEKLIPKTIIRALKGLKVPIYGSGRNVRDWIFVEDHCEAVMAALVRGKPGGIYNISAGNELDNLSLVKRILRTLGLSDSLIEHVGDRPGHDFRYSLDSSKTRKELGWAPRHSFDEALKKTVEWYVENEWWWCPIADERVLSPAPWNLKW